MSISIYNSLTRKKEEFKPLSPPQVKIYVCGPTVYDESHIGHARSAYIFDVVRRYLIYKGYKVTFVRNVTDVDDKIIEKARNEYKGEDLKSAVKKVADKYLTAYHEALESLGIATHSPEVIEPKASEYIDKMIVFIKGLIDKGAAYQAGADVYFDITQAENYGKLSHQALDKMEVGARVAPLENKNNPLDFTLWKSVKEGEPSWDSPYGKGRPGWHIECSVMSSDILGDEFDIHGGGLDLIFPHHENEIAQAEGAGKNFARIWIHHGLLTINGQKMAKSLGNFVTIKDFIDKYKKTDILKLFLLSAHYSHPIDYNKEKIEETKKALERFEILLRKTGRIVRDPHLSGIKFPARKVDFVENYKNNFFEAMDDDFNTPKALSYLFDLVNAANKFIDSEENESKYVETVYQVQTTIEELGKNIFGLFPDFFEEPLSPEEKKIVEEYEYARRKKDYSLSDKIRKELAEKGIILEDTKEGTTWRRKL